MRRVKFSLKGIPRLLPIFDAKAAIGIGSLIIFIAMIIVAGMAASVIMQTMNSLQQQAMETGEETVKDVSSGLKVTHVSGKANSTKINQLAVFVSPSAASGDIDMTYTYMSLSETAKQVILSYTSACYSSSVSGGLFGTLNASNLSSTTYGIMVIRDVDSSCLSTTPTINNDDLIVLLINTTKCFSGIATRAEVFGNVIPEQGISGVIGFTTPSAYVDTIIELQP